MKRLLTSCFGLGWMPLFPGTWGSLPPVIIFTLMLHFGLSAVSTAIVMAVLALAGSVVCVIFSPAVIEITGKIDPREVVADEIAGQAITFLAVLFSPIDTFSTKQILMVAALGFFFFRLFDAVKPFPVHQAESLPKGWGILADDILAGVYAAIALLVCIRLWM